VTDPVAELAKFRATIELNELMRQEAARAREEAAREHEETMRRLKRQNEIAAVKVVRKARRGASSSPSRSTTSHQPPRRSASAAAAVRAAPDPELVANLRRRIRRMRAQRNRKVRFQSRKASGTRS